VLQKAGWALPRPFLYLQYFSTIKKNPHIYGHIIKIIVKRQIVPLRNYADVMKLKLHLFSSLELNGHEWGASRPGSFVPREKALGIHRIGGLLGSSVTLHTTKHRKSSCQESFLVSPVV
jgi:hypothetical protein